MLGLLLEIVLVLLIAAVLLWALSQFPIDPTIARVIRVVVIAIVAIWLIFRLFGVLDGLPREPHRHLGVLHQLTSSFTV